MVRTFFWLALCAVLSSSAFPQSGEKPPAFELADIHPKSAPVAIKRAQDLSMKGPLRGWYPVRVDERNPA